MFNLNRLGSSNSFVGFNEDMKLKPEYLHHQLSFLNNFGIGQIIPGKKFVDINARVVPRVNCTSTVGFHTKREVHMGAPQPWHEGTESTFRTNCNYNRADYKHTERDRFKSWSESQEKMDRWKSTEASPPPEGGSCTFRSNSSSKSSSKNRESERSSEREEKMNKSEVTKASAPSEGCSSRKPKKNQKSKRKRRNFQKQSKKESDRCIFPRAPKNKNKPWHKPEGMDVDEEEPSLDITISYSTPHMECEISISPKIRPEICLSPRIRSEACLSTIRSEVCLSPKVRSEVIRTEVCLSPKIRPRMPSECESEDSFIVFEDSNSGCFSFEESEEESEDDSCEESESESGDSSPAKKVRFASGKDLCEIHPMVQWSFAYQRARKGPWEQYALDRMRFSHRVAAVGRALDSVLQPGHRARVYRDRFQD